MKTIAILDTSIASTNLGDCIIMDSIRETLFELYSDAFYVYFQTHDVISKQSYRLINQCGLRFLGGTNLLSSNMDRYNQWKITLWSSLFMKNIILLGVGWWQYQNAPNMYTRILLNKVLSKDYFHSVRDSYTEKQLRLIGIKNVINTSCPTTWCLTNEHCEDIPIHKAKDVLLTYTEYNQKLECDRKVFKVLAENYDKIYFWTQQPKDYTYMKKIGGDRVEYISPNLHSLNEILSLKDLDYIGTRLHAGIRALQYKKRTLILAVDNRAAEISKDINLPVINREKIDQIESWINSSYKTEIKLPEQNIERWKKQFVD